MSYVSPPDPYGPSPSARWRSFARSCVALATVGLAVFGPAAFVAETEPAPAVTARTETKDESPKKQKQVTAQRYEGAPSREQLDVFRGLGAWIDLFDVDLDAEAYIAQMKASGVRTLYIQTGRGNSDTRVDPRVNRWLVAAHEAGLKVVGWYLPFYDRPVIDLVRTVEVARHEYKGHRFDALGIDIEYRAAVSGAFTWNRRVVEHLKAVRKEL